MNKLFIVVVLFALTLSSMACSVINESSGSTRALATTVYETNIPRSSHQVALIGIDSVAIIGGVNSAGCISQTQIINANTGVISDGPVLNNGRYLFAMNQIDKNRVVVAGGYYINNGSRSVINSIEMVNFANNTSIIIAYLPKPLADFASVYVKEQEAIYYIGGESSGGSISNNIYKFSVANYSMTTMSSMTYGRQDHTANLIGDSIIIIGGYDGTAMAAIENFNIKGNSCSLVANLRHGRFIHKTIQIDYEKFLICGGYDGSNSIASTEIYDYYNNTVYRSVNLTSAKDAFTLEKLFDGRIIVGGGAYNGAAKSEIDVMAINSLSIKPLGSLTTPRDTPASVVISGDRILYSCGYYNGTFLSTVEVISF